MKPTRAAILLPMASWAAILLPVWAALTRSHHDCSPCGFSNLDHSNAVCALTAKCGIGEIPSRPDSSRAAMAARDVMAMAAREGSGRGEEKEEGGEEEKEEEKERGQKKEEEKDQEKEERRRELVDGARRDQEKEEKGGEGG